MAVWCVILAEGRGRTGDRAPTRHTQSSTWKSDSEVSVRDAGPRKAERRGMPACGSSTESAPAPVATRETPTTGNFEADSDRKRQTRPRRNRARCFPPRQETAALAQRGIPPGPARPVTQAWCGVFRSGAEFAGHAYSTRVKRICFRREGFRVRVCLLEFRTLKRLGSDWSGHCEGQQRSRQGCRLGEHNLSRPDNTTPTRGPPPPPGRTHAHQGTQVHQGAQGESLEGSRSSPGQGTCSDARNMIQTSSPSHPPASESQADPSLTRKTRIDRPAAGQRQPRAGCRHLRLRRQAKSMGKVSAQH